MIRRSASAFIDASSFSIVPPPLRSRHLPPPGARKTVGCAGLLHLVRSDGPREARREGEGRRDSPNPTREAVRTLVVLSVRHLRRSGRASQAHGTHVQGREASMDGREVCKRKLGAAAVCYQAPMESWMRMENQAKRMGSKTVAHSAIETTAGSGGGLVNLAIGPVVQCMEAATLGMPFEVWKTRMGRYRNEGTFQSFANVYRNGGGLKAFWKGTGAKMVESATKGGILMYSKENINAALLASGVSPTMAGLSAGAGGGVCQVLVMGPCTYLVTGAVTGDQSVSTMQRINQTYARSGIKGFYPGGTAIAFRQATNWASRQGFTEAVRERFKIFFHGNKDAKLTKWQEVAAGTVGGTLACWNHPFEVARIEMQARGDQGQKSIGMLEVFREISKEHGVGGLFKGLVPRVCLGIWQTLFMVTGAKLVKDQLQEAGLL